jgi:hypothetical protein
MADFIAQKGDIVVAKRSYPYVNLYQGNRGEVMDAGNFIRVKWMDSREKEQMYSFSKVQFHRYFNLAKPEAATAEGAQPETEKPAAPEPPAAITGRWRQK